MRVLHRRSPSIATAKPSEIKLTPTSKNKTPKMISPTLFIVFVLATISPSCALYQRAWREDRVCFDRCRADYGLAFGGGRYSLESEYCMCVTQHDGVVATVLAPVKPDPAGPATIVWPYVLPPEMRRCGGDRTTIICGEF
jgi:hypothetical protein